MKLVNHLNKSKRGQLGFDIADIFSYLGYFIVILLIIIILSLPSCLTGLDTKKVDTSLQEKANPANLVSADTQLTSYLRTQMPGKDELSAKLAWAESKKDFLRTTIVYDALLPGSTTRFIPLDVKKARGFLERHPEVYAGKDYSGFLSSLYAFDKTSEQGDMEMAFKVVTTALFVRGFSNGKKLGSNNDGYTYYMSPLSVDFKNYHPGELGNDMDYKLSVGILPSEMLPDRKVESIQVIPLADSTLAKVRLTYYPERSSWLPQP